MDSTIVLVPKVTNCQNGRYRKLPPEQWEWAHSRSSVPPLLEARGISLQQWQHTFDAVQRTRIQTQKESKANKSYKMNALFCGIAIGAALAVPLFLIIPRFFSFIKDDRQQEFQSVFQVVFISILYFAVVLGVTHWRLQNNICNRASVNAAWQSLCEEQNDIYRKLGNIHVSLEGLFKPGSTEGMVMGLKFEALTTATHDIEATMTQGEEEMKYLLMDQVL